MNKQKYMTRLLLTMMISLACSCSKRRDAELALPIDPGKVFPADKILTIEIKADKTAMINAEKLTLDEVKNYLVANKNSFDHVQLKVDGSVPQADVITVMDALVHAGIESVTFSED